MNEKALPVRVLIVDDELQITQMFEGGLGRKGYECSSASSATEALAILGQREYDIAIIDINLGDMNGIELLGRIRGLYDTDIIIITGDIDTYSYTPIIEQGAEDFILKPVKMSEVVLKIARIAKKRKLITDLNRAKADVQARLMTQKAYSAILSGFLREKELDDAICLALQSVGKSLDSEYAALFLFSGDEDISGTHIWRAGYNIQKKTAVPRFKKCDFAALISRIQKDEHILFRTVEEIPEIIPLAESVSRRKEKLKIIIQPVSIFDRLEGFILIGTMTSNKSGKGEEIDLVSITAEMIGMGLDKKNAEQRLIEALARAEEADKQKSEFVATVSHELRTPLNGILGFGDLLLKEDLPLELREYVEAIRQSSLHMSSLLSDLMDLSRIETGHIQIVKKICHVSDVLALASDYARMLLSRTKKEIRVFVELDKDANVYIYADEMRLIQILNNLISNAIKFTEEGFIGIRAYIPDSGFVEFSVEDTGSGIPEDKHEEIFDAFKQLDSGIDPDHRGTGLGLSISKKLIGLMGGSIRLKSSQSPDHGTTFYFTIPFEPASIQAAIDNSENYAPRAVSAGHTVLLVEDDRISMLLAQRILEKNGYTVKAVQNGSDAISAYESSLEDEIDLIIMDIHVPVKNGFEATMEIREFELEHDRHHVPIIALTAMVMKGEREKCLSSGCDDFLPKPVDYDTLVRIVDQYVQNTAPPKTNNRETTD